MYIVLKKWGLSLVSDQLCYSKLVMKFLAPKPLGLSSKTVRT